MPPRAPDRELRRVVAELASATTEDVEAVLDGLEGDHRRQVADLLTAYIGGPTAAPPRSLRASPPEPPRLAGLSPWLALRLRLARRLDAVPAAASGWLGPPARGPVVAMTPTALRALAAGAAGLAPAPPPVPAAPSLRDRLARLRRRGGPGS